MARHLSVEDLMADAYPPPDREEARRVALRYLEEKAQAEKGRRPYDDRYAQLALGFADKIRKKVGRFEIAPKLWELADYLERVDSGKHDQHLIMLGSKWVKSLTGTSNEQR